MNFDWLARHAARAQAAIDRAEVTAGDDYEAGIVVPAPTFLALVEIARGMERIEKTCDVVVQRIAEVGEPPAALSGTQIDAERMRDFARAALARLDSGAENTVGEPEPSFLVYDRVSNNILGEYESLDEAERYAAQINALNPSCAPVEVLRVSDDS